MRQIRVLNKLRVVAYTSALIFFGILGVAIYFGIPFFVKGPSVLPVRESGLETGGAVRKIDGVLVPPGRENLGIYAVIVENNVDARPLSGLARASLVYEAPVEGGITRFLAIFSADEKVPEIGPVRSARPYFIDLAEEFGGIFAHVGGSDAALDQLGSDQNVVDLNQYYKSEYFWRDGKRFAPHNVYTSSDLLAAAGKNLGVPPPIYDGWLFKADLPLDRRPEKNEIAVDSPMSAYRVEWIYDRVHNNYLRYGGGKIQKDKNGPAVRAKNVIVLKTDIEIIDAITRRAIRTMGDGEATIFRDGEAVAARWKKDNLKSRLKFYDSNGDEILFNTGPTWIEIVAE